MNARIAIRLACPDDSNLLIVATSGLSCPHCRRNFSGTGGIIGLLPQGSLTDGTYESRQLENYSATFSQRSDKPWLQPFREFIAKLGNAYLYSWVRRSIEAIAADRSLMILDAACGEGILRRYVAGRHCYTGVDFSSRPLARAMRYHPADYFRADLNHLPFASASFDVVVSIQALQYLDRPDLALAQIARVLKPGGHFLLSVPNDGSFKYRRQGVAPIQLQRFRRDNLTALLSKNFQIKSMETRGLWVPLPKFSVHLHGIYRESWGLSWTCVSIRKS
jgi:SAM-dependent methyltransferase